MYKTYVSLDTLRERERERERESRLLKTKRKATKNCKTNKAYKNNEIKVNNLNKGCKNVAFINHMQELSFLDGFAI